MNKINHIVLSGGAYLGLYELGALNHLYDHKFYEYQNIKTIHGTSIGGLIGTIMCVEPNMNDICQYFIHRPWFKVIQISPTMIFDIIPKKGFIGRDVFQSVLEPIFKNNNLNINITLLELYEQTQKELYMYTINLDTFEIVQLSYKTHPNLDVITAVHMTCALPYLIQPVWYENNFYIDGGILNNFPINKCLEPEDVSEENIIAVSFDANKERKKTEENINIFEYGYILYRKLSENVRNTHNKKDRIFKNQIIIPCTELNLHEGYNVLNSIETRKHMIDIGENYAKLFMLYKQNEIHQGSDREENILLNIHKEHNIIDNKENIQGILITSTNFKSYQSEIEKSDNSSLIFADINDGCNVYMNSYCKFCEKNNVITITCQYCKDTLCEDCRYGDEVTFEGITCCDKRSFYNV